MVFKFFFVCLCAWATMCCVCVCMFPKHTKQYHTLKKKMAETHCIYSHSSLLFYENLIPKILFCGGIYFNAKHNDFGYQNNFYVFNLKSKQYESLKFQSFENMNDCIFLGHKMICDIDKTDNLWIIGGGCNVFSFGTIHNKMVKLILNSNLTQSD